MELSELTAYAGDRYQMYEKFMWKDFPGFSVLAHPKTGKWVALLMRQWDTDTGTEIQRCDMKCGRGALQSFSRPYLSLPVRMHGDKWIGIAFDRRTEADTVFALLDLAMTEEKRPGFTIVLESPVKASEQSYQETLLPFPGSPVRPARETTPERLRQMRHLFEYGIESVETRAGNFYRQAVFMQDYEDDLPWTGSFSQYFPTYRDMTTRQLRGYFTWRTHLRKGEYQPIASSAAYIYIYELLNGIGCASPEDSLQKLRDFEKGFLDSGIGDERIRPNLHRWMLEFAVLKNLPADLAEEVADPALIRGDMALAALKAPDACSDEILFEALCYFGKKKLASTPVLVKEPERGRHLFCEAWRKAQGYQIKDKNLFTLCFGEMQTRRWHPLYNAVYCERTRPEDRDYRLSDVRTYACRNGIWQMSAYEKLFFDKDLLQGFLHETEAKLRRYLKCGRPLREKAADAWAIPYIEAVIREDEKAVIEASRPKITIDLSGLEKIRRDAMTTRDSLLIDEAQDFHEETEEAAAEAGTEDAAEARTDLQKEMLPEDIPLDALQVQILRSLLEGGDAAKIMKDNHLMPSIVADAINEAFFDEIGDTVLLCEGDLLSLVEDYIEDVENYLGG